MKTVDGNWVPVQPIKDSIVVNTGELLEYWTGGYFSATVSLFTRTKNDLNVKLLMSEL